MFPLIYVGVLSMKTPHSECLVDKTPGSLRYLFTTTITQVIDTYNRSEDLQTWGDVNNNYRGTAEVIIDVTKDF